MKLTEGEPSGLSGPDVLRLLNDMVAQEREECAQLADGTAERLSRSGKHAEAEVALQVAAQIRARAK